jgi:SAM-dependent methyltransferase
MNRETQRRLLEINRQFYQTFGKAFSATRGKIQPGVSRILETLQGEERILDIGCGNGSLLRALALRHHRGEYLGLDFSLPLLEEADTPFSEFPARCLQADIASAFWGDFGGAWDIVTAFAVMHHLPGEEIRLRLLENVRTLLARGGRFIHSEWQFLHSERLRKRIQPWEEVRLDAESVDEGDYLLDWRHGGRGVRYVHHFSERELASLAERSGFRILQTFYSDGKEGNLAVYQIWTPK